MLTFNLKSLPVHLERYRKQKIPYRISGSNNSFTVVTYYSTRYYTDSKISGKGLNLIKAVRKYVKDNDIVNKIARKDAKELGTQYMQFDKRFINQKGIGIVEIDEDASYWTKALKLGIINQELFDKGMAISQMKDKDGNKDKISRLAACGTLGRRLRARDFDGEGHSPLMLVPEELDARHLWDRISFETDIVMQACLKKLKSDCLYYWTDAIFMKATVGNIKTVKSTIEGLGYSCKAVQNLWYDFREDACYIYSLEKGKQIKEKEVSSQLNKENLKWIKENVDLSLIMKKEAIKKATKKKNDNTPFWMRKIEPVIDSPPLIDNKKEWDYDTIVNNANSKPLSVRENLKRANIIGISDVDLRKKLYDRILVRNFCYSMGNQKIWKGRKMKVLNSSKKRKKK